MMNNPEPIRAASEIEFLPGLTVWIGDNDIEPDQAIQFVPAPCVFIGEADRRLPDDVCAPDDGGENSSDDANDRG
jgi:hypothetical protein